MYKYIMYTVFLPMFFNIYIHYDTRNSLLLVHFKGQFNNMVRKIGQFWALIDYGMLKRVLWAGVRVVGTEKRAIVAGGTLREGLGGKAGEVVRR